MELGFETKSVFARCVSTNQCQLLTFSRLTFYVVSKNVYVGTYRNIPKRKKSIKKGKMWKKKFKVVKIKRNQIV